MAAILRVQALFALPMLALLLAMLWLNQGEFIYSLDDPYIHLALARQIAEGHYGIQPGEHAAPSSSLLWPLLLAPWARSGLAEWLPLLINVLSCLATLHHLRRSLEQAWGVSIGIAPIWLLAVLLNLYGLVFTGMEHSLQVLLVVWATRLLMERRQEPLLIALLCIMPWLRYESAAIAMPLLVHLAVSGRYRRLAVLGLLASMAGLAAFSWFLHGLGLGYLPSSVLAKAQVRDPASLAANVWNNWRAHLFAPLLVWLVCRHLAGQASLMAAVVCASLLYYTLGRNGWFGRYEVFYLVFMVMLALPVVAQRLRDRTGLAALYGLLVAGPVLAGCTLVTPLASQNIRDQQGSLAELARVYGRPVAVNDLGLVAWRSGQRVLDLWGLGSHEALRARLAGPEGRWVCDLMARRGVMVAMVHPDVFHVLPPCWIPVGSWRAAGPMVAPSPADVGVYAMTPGAAQEMVRAMAAVMPGRHVRVTTAPPQTR